jgi:DNA-binding Lrp family transcriptional regulator
MIRPSRLATVSGSLTESTRPMQDPLRSAVPHVRAGHGEELSTLERFVLSKVNGRRSVVDLAGLVEISCEEALAIVLSLLERGVVRIEGARKPPPRRPISGVRARVSVEPGDEEITLGDDDVEEIVDALLASDDPADADVFAADTVAGTMRALTHEEAERLVALAGGARPTKPRG